MPGCYSKYIHTGCDVIYHSWQPNCHQAQLEVLYHSVLYSFKLYAPLYFATALLTRKKKEYFIKKLYKEILQSTAFLSSNAFFYLLFFCLVRKVFGRFYVPTVGFLPGLLASFCAIMIERKSRRGALAIYMLNQGFDTTFNMLKAAGLAKHIEYGEVMIFSASLSVLMYLYRNNNLPDGMIKNILNYFFKDDKEKKITHQQINNNDDKLQNSYLQESLQLTSKAFGIGYGIQASYFLIMALPKLFKKPSQLILALFNKNNAKLGAFFATLVGLYKFVEKLLSNSSSSSLNPIVAGGVAGSSMMILRSSTISLYVLSKTLEMFYLNGIEKGFLPYVKHFDTILYTCCTALMFHAAILEPTSLKRSYWNFIMKLSGYKLAGVNRKPLIALGYNVVDLK